MITENIRPVPIETGVYPLVLGVIGGIEGGLLGIIAVVLRAIFDTPFGFAGAQLGVVHVAPEIGLVWIAGIEFTFLHVLFGSIYRSTVLSWARMAAIYVSVLSVFAGAAWTVQNSAWSLSVQAIVVGSSLAIILYGVHRYEVVALGHVSRKPNDE